MPPTANKTLSPAELAKLEHAFATDPSSEAYRPLAEAYLGMGRFMEAMVVCKKGVKAHPNRADPRVLLARVYAEQGKDKKALEELASALQVAPADKVALRLTGSLQLKTGEADVGKANLLKAFEADPADQDTLAAMQQYKVEAPKPAAPPPPPQPVAPPPSNGVPQNGGQGHEQPMQAHPQQRAMQQQRPAQQQGRPAQQQGRAAQQQGRPAQQARQPQRRYDVAEDSTSSVSSVSEISELPRRRSSKSSHGFTKFVFFTLVVVVPVGLGLYYGLGQYFARQAREVHKLVNAAVDAAKNDSFDSYKKATKSCEDALNITPSSAEAHSICAYAYTVLWGEHGTDDRARAEEHIEAAKKAKGDNKLRGQLLAADALFQFFNGKGADAQKQLKGEVESLEDKSGRAAPVLYLTLGFLQMQAGDLEKAKENMDKAQQGASDDPRVYAALGTLSRRRGNDPEALRYYSTALKYTHNSHPEALLGSALLVLDQENPAQGYVSAAGWLKTLLESEPPPSPRELAMAHMVRAFLISRVAHDAPLYDKDFGKKLLTDCKVDPEKAKADVQKEEQAAMSDQNNPELYLVKGKRLLYEGEFNASADEIKKAIAMNNTRAYYWSELAKAYMHKEGGEKDAENALRQALGLVPDSPKLMTQLAQALYKQKKVDEALDTYKKATKDPKTKNPEAHFGMGKILCDDKKDYGAGADNYDKAASEFVGDTQMVSASYDLEGLCLLEKHDNSRARDKFESAMNADHDNDKAVCDYVRLLVKGGDAKDKEKLKGLADGYLKLAPQGACAAEMKALGGELPKP